VGCEVVEGTRYITKALTLPAGLPLGYHRFSLELPGRPPAKSLVIVAPGTAFTHLQDGHGPSWGVFLPLYALQSNRSWGSGNFSDLEALASWAGGLGAKLVATLPLLPVFLDEPFDPSPYAPVSRLMWNEFYLDVSRVPELQQCPAARELVCSPGFQEEVGKLRRAPLVDYRLGMALRRRALEEVSRHFFSAPTPGRLEALDRFAAANPYVDDYARFRAAGEKLMQPWHSWPERQRGGTVGEGDFDQEVKDYHRYVQWQSHDQMDGLCRAAQKDGVRLYLDLPLGVHPGGYDSWRWQQLFAPKVAVGSPPDAFFTRGQNWGFHPLHPEKLRDSGYEYFTRYLRHHLKQAGLLRIDHVMSLHRLFCIPLGMAPSQGVYLRYPAQEFYAILSLESHRQQAGIVGEDLGTVPREVRAAMGRHGLSRMYVVYFNLSAEGEHRGLTPVPRGALASVNTHDLPPFAAFYRGEDIVDRVEPGHQSGDTAAQAQEIREGQILALRSFLLGKGVSENAHAGPSEVLPALQPQARP
jgi:4-alpha-glucanotransferase